MNAAKKHFYDIGEIKPLEPGRGGCVASDRIVVDGCPVGYMYRGAPIREMDSGWQFVAGDEDDAYLDDPRFRDVYDVNTIVNFDPAIRPYLDAPPGSAFERMANGTFRRVEQGAPGAPPP